MYNDLVTIENLFNAWYEFKKGKSNKPDVMLFELNLEDNIFQLYEDLITKNYFHQPYHTFYIWDPKFRIINKASVRDRVVHHLLYKYLEKIYQPIFIYHSYSCQAGKGVHKAVSDLSDSIRKMTKNYTKNIWYLKLDIKKFFANVDHEVLLRQLKNRVYDPDVIWLLEKVIRSFVQNCHPRENGNPTLDPRLRGDDNHGVGIPIGNLTSQIFANIYMNELDYFVKFNLREKYYFRYADDFIFLHESQEYLEKLKDVICQFVTDKLKLTVHPNKIFLQKFNQGLDFLGYVLLPHHQILRTKTKQRMFKKTKEKVEEFNDGLISDFELGQTVQSYLGVLAHCDGYEVRVNLRNEVWVDKQANYFFKRHLIIGEVNSKQ
ncbi:MAG: Retron-type reverse transcriptase [Candidatus Magasanikbacteria bacterium GW2011_GWC2_34_16]|uniref:Retron-type reverse transcriptase n=2 Tax=Candidatus Magasanikiibacteriota TaxID=1752731 RepID=A0A0G0HRC4_9BACT|nr:MAG: Retron-type reverse transcriptase [Candidatus Magasanikbacteria bacterium GW2011_GWC2_34_16]KKQ41145.1 MAG: Retron-type reverse transcriptase [Candidatus Magasanikbacteria bacterium GW2011_GWA2_37_8]